MKQILLVGCGGFIGAVLRHGIGSLVSARTQCWRLPCGTLVVNLCGCLILGLLMGAAHKYEFLTSNVRLLVVTGVLGGFTTFSAFGLDTVTLLQRDEMLWAAAYVLLTVAGGVVALWLGMCSVR